MTHSINLNQKIGTCTITPDVRFNGMLTLEPEFYQRARISMPIGPFETMKEAEEAANEIGLEVTFKAA